MSENQSFLSVWSQALPYWICIEGPLAASFAAVFPLHNKHNLGAIKADQGWATVWQHHEAALLGPAAAGHRVAVIASESLPTLAEIIAALKPVQETARVVENLWLIDSINHGQLGCYMQRVMDRRNTPVGYEAFARMEAADGGVIGGGAIMQAAHALKVEYQLDRVLHKQAIDSYVASDLHGYIFINFLTGFIHRPEVYLDGLSQAVSRSQVLPSAVVLDVPLSDYAKDLAKLKSIAHYCHTRGFGLALDDVTSSEGLAGLLADIHPAIVKLDGKLGHGLPPARAQALLHDIVRVSHAAGVSVLAEGVETKAQHETLLAADVDMFQGYLFGAPERHPRAVHEAVASSGTR